ncbi:MAG TPA: ATP-binding protein [Acidimicrobiales bacterium]|nr:ATP-binding protein [Acidimicrobiales bacterium]
MTLAGQPASVSAARRFVRNALASFPELSDDAGLITTELVANAVLHAGGPITVRAAVDPGPPSAVRLEISDGSPVAPVVREYGTVASTGRGLGLVARVARRWGVEPSAGGKTVWVELAPGSAQGGEHRPSAPSSTLTATSEETAAQDARDVEFLGVPVAVYLRLQEQNDAVLRELELLAFTADHAGELDPSPQLVDVIERSRRYFNATREGFRAEVFDAAERGLTSVDLQGRMTVTSIVPAADLVALFEQAEELARAGELLIGPAEDDVARLRRWFVAEVTGQLLEGRSPQPFST